MSKLIKPSQSRGLILPLQYLYGILCDWKESNTNWTVPQEELHLHPWPFQPETKELGLRGTWLVVNLTTTYSLPSSESRGTGKCKLRISLLFESWVLLEHTPYIMIISRMEIWLQKFWSLVCMIAVGLLRQCSLTCYHAIVSMDESFVPSSLF